MQVTSPLLSQTRFAGTPALTTAPVRFGEEADVSAFFNTREAASRQLVEALKDSAQYYDFRLREQDGILGFLADAVKRLGGKETAEGKVAEGLFDDRAKEYRAERRAAALEAIRNGASPEAVISYEKSYQQFVDEPVLQYAIYNHDADIVEAFCETSPQDTLEAFEKHPAIFTDILAPGLNTNHTKRKADDKLDNLLIRELGIEAFAEQQYRSPGLSGSFLLGAVYHARPAFVRALAENGQSLSEREASDLLDTLNRDLERATQRFESPGQQSSPKGLKGKFLVEDLQTIEEVAKLATTAIDQSDVGPAAVFAARRDELLARVQEVREKHNLVGLSA